MRAWEIVTYICAAIGGFLLFTGLAGANGAPQEAAAAAIAAAFVIIPYAVTSTMQRREILKKLGNRVE